GLGDPLTARFGDSERDTEVRNQRLTLVQQNIFGLEVPVNYTVPMCVVQRRGDRGCNMNRFVDGELSFPDQLCAQRFAFDERHYVVQQSGGFAALEQRQQVRMLKVGSNLNFREES